MLLNGVFFRILTWVLVCVFFYNKKFSDRLWLDWFPYSLSFSCFLFRIAKGEKKRHSVSEVFSSSVQAKVLQRSGGGVYCNEKV